MSSHNCLKFPPLEQSSEAIKLAAKNVPLPMFGNTVVIFSKSDKSFFRLYRTLENFAYELQVELGRVKVISHA